MRKLILEMKCTTCGRVFKLEVEIDDYHKWQGGMHVQDAFPYLSADQRELLVSRTCGDCFDAMFAEEEV